MKLIQTVSIFTISIQMKFFEEDDHNYLRRINSGFVTSLIQNIKHSILMEERQKHYFVVRTFCSFGERIGH